jgi:hypothetical protein
MTQNTVEFMRKYADIINEAQQPEQLAEGALDDYIQKAKQLYNKIPRNVMQGMTAEVAKLLGKQPQDLSWSDVTMDNAKKVAAVMKANTPQQNEETDPMSTAAGATIGAGFGTYLGLGATAMIASGTATAGMVGLVTAGILAIIFGVLGAAFGSEEKPKRPQTAPTPASKIHPVNRTAVAPTPTKPQTDINGNPI